MNKMLVFKYGNFEIWEDRDDYGETVFNVRYRKHGFGEFLKQEPSLSLAKQFIKEG